MRVFGLILVAVGAVIAHLSTSLLATAVGVALVFAGALLFLAAKGDRKW